MPSLLRNPLAGRQGRDGAAMFNQTNPPILKLTGRRYLVSSLLLFAPNCCRGHGVGIPSHCVPAEDLLETILLWIDNRIGRYIHFSRVEIHVTALSNH